MKKLLLFPIILLHLLFLLQGCQKPKEQVGLYAGTSPLIELNDNGELRNIQPSSLFIRIMADKLEYLGNSYDFQITDEDDQTITMGTNLVINQELEINEIVYNKLDKNISLILNNINAIIMLDEYDQMVDRKVQEFVEVKLTSDISQLTANQKEMIGILFEVADIMDEIYWSQVFQEKDAVFASLLNENVIKFFKINYGPWERLNGDLPFMQGYSEKPAGSGYYPDDMTKEEFDALEDPAKNSLYTLLKRDDNGKLMVIPYHVAYKPHVEKASELLKKAAALAEDKGFRNYLSLLSEAFLSDDYYPSDMAWMDMKDNTIDFIAGPIENYEDKLYNYKAAHESFILIKDKEWSDKLKYVAALLPQLQKNLPVPEKYKTEVPGSDSDLGSYDVVYYAGDCNAGSKTIAINLPNDEQVQNAKGSRKLQLKNSIRYKFEEILVPISNVLIAEDQREHIKFEAFFENVMYHEVAHGLGINHTINGKGTVRGALKEQYSALEEGKADILGLYLITQLKEMGVTPEKDLMDNYVTFMAGIFRSVRFGVASSHGKANMIRFYYFQEAGAFSKDPETGTYRIDFEKMQDAMNSLAETILTIQGDGNYNDAKLLVDEKGYIRDELNNDLEKLSKSNIPVDIIFKQGPEILGI